ncbi:MAG: acyl--CoA ligase [Halioglobus sp.]|nr:acyl--CoA ligase [Halioglobus sp.]
MEQTHGTGVALQPDTRRYTWAHFIEDVAARHGDKSVIRFEGRAISATSLLAESRALAKALAALGVTKGMRVAVHMANRPEFAVASFAVAMLGAVLAPVNTFATKDEREYILRHSDSAVLLFQKNLLKYDFLEELLEFLPELSEGKGPLYCKRTPQLRHAVAFGLEGTRGQILGWDDFIKSGEDFPDDVLDAMIAEVFPADDGCIIYTSGTTSRPKGVLHMQRAAVIQSWLIADEMRFTSDDRVWTTYPFFWSAGICMALGATIGAGATLILQETFEPGAALQCLVDEKANATQAWPHQAKAMAEHPLCQTLDLSHIDKEVYRLQPDIPPEEDLWGTQGSFGMTETFTFTANLPADAPVALRNGTSGKLRAGMTVRILDPATGKPLPPGEAGEIAVKGLTLMRGYYKVDPETTFDADGYYHSADGGHIDDKGYVHWTGRISNLIKTGGANVSPMEIEESLLGFPGMRTGIPFGAPHPSLGEVIVLCAVAMQGCALKEEDIRAFLQDKLAVYKLPKHILMFEETDLDFTGNQKIQVNKLVDKALARLRDEAVTIDGVNYRDYLVTTAVSG